MNDSLTSAAAWYGAVLATLTFGFNIVKWMLERPRLRIRIVPTCYADGEVLKVEKTEHGEVTTLADYYHVEIVNVGERATTIMGVEAKAGFSGYAGSAFLPHDDKKVPYAIGPGDVWSCRVRRDKIDGLRPTGMPKLQITATCWRAPRLIAFPTA